MRRFDGLSRLEILSNRGCAPSARILRPEVVSDEAKAFRALGDETRLQIVQILAQQSAPLCVCDLEAAFDLSQPTISHHLKVLRDAGLVTAERRGVWIYYQADSDRLVQLVGTIDALAGKTDVRVMRSGRVRKLE